MSQNTKNEPEEAVKMGMLIAAQMMQIFDEESNYHIGDSVLEEDLTLFVYAMACVAPAIVYGKLTGGSENFLEFNHIANQLCFQYMKVEE